MSETATLKIWRGQDKAHGRWETHQVPFERGQSVLDGLRWIRVNQDPTPRHPLFLHQCQCLQGMHDGM